MIKKSINFPGKNLSSKIGGCCIDLIVLTTGNRVYEWYKNAISRSNKSPEDKYCSKCSYS